MASSPQPTANGGGIVVTLRAAFSAGLLAGLVLGIADGIAAGCRTHTLGVGAWLGCLASSVVLYGAVWVSALLAIGLVFHLLLRKQPLNDRSRSLLAIALGINLFLDMYWWTRPWVYYGVPATDPRRLLAAAVLALVGLALGWQVVRIGARLPLRLKLAGAVLVPVAWCGGIAFMVAERAQVAEIGAVNARNRDLPNVLLIINDAMRADVLGCYGNERVKTPVIDELASRGVLFENAFVQAPFTWSSFGSYLTGKYPRRHGLVKMEAGYRLPENITLPIHLKTAERVDGGAKLKPDDYYTAAFMTGTISQGSGLLRGFDTYFESMVGHELVDVDDAWSVFRSELVLVIAWQKLQQRIDDAPTANEAVAWLDKNAHKRFCSWVHFYATHTPYDPPRRFRDMYVDPQYSGPIKSFYAEARIVIERGDYKLTQADEAQIANLYYGGVSQADAMVGAILDELRRQGVLDNTLVIVTGDHGEELGDHGVWEHNFMFQTNLRVPLIMAWPGHLPAGKRVHEIVESIDVLPTICELCGLKPPHEVGRVDAEGRDFGKIDGVSMMPLVEGTVPKLHDYSYAENGMFMAVQDLEWKLIVPCDAVSEAGWNTLLASNSPKPRLFDLAHDPRETTNAFDGHEAEVARLLAALRAWDASLPIRSEEIMESDRDREQMRLLLQQLGYAGGVGQGVKSPQKDSQQQDSTQKPSAPKAPDHK